MNKLQLKKHQVIQFKYVNYNINNPPNDKYMLAIDTHDKELYIYNHGKAISIKQSITKELLNSQGKLKVDVIPNQLSNKVWTINEIRKHVSSIFHLKGAKKLYTDIYTIPNPQIGDVWVCKLNGFQYAYIGNGKWQQLGTAACIDAQIFSGILQRLDGFQEKLREQIKRAQAAQQQLHNQILATNEQVEYNRGLISSVSGKVDQLSGQLFSVSSTLSSQFSKTTTAISSALDYNTQELSAGISSCIQNIFLYDESYEDLYNLSEQLENKIFNK